MGGLPVPGERRHVVVPIVFSSCVTWLKERLPKFALDDCAHHDNRKVHRDPGPGRGQRPRHTPRARNGATTLAMMYYKMAIDRGNADAACNLGLMYDKGDGVSRDPSKAVMYSKMAADGGQLAS